MNDQISSLRDKMRSSPPQPTRGAQKMPLNRLAVTQTGGILARIFKRPANWVRRHKRFPCCFVAVLTLIQKEIPIDGLVTEISQGGLVFRPASSFIFDRRGNLVTIKFGDEALNGQIVNVTGNGYGIRFAEDLDAEEVDAILANYGLVPA